MPACLNSIIIKPKKAGNALECSKTMSKTNKPNNQKNVRTGNLLVPCRLGTRIGTQSTTTHAYLSEPISPPVQSGSKSILSEGRQVCKVIKGTSCHTRGIWNLGQSVQVIPVNCKVVRSAMGWGQWGRHQLQQLPTHACPWKG